jgi:hypothetical protein
MRPWPSSDQVRDKLVELVASDAVSLSRLSVMLGRYPGYLRRYVNLGRPEWLEPDDRTYLARWFNVDTFELGDRDKVKPD